MARYMFAFPLHRTQRKMIADQQPGAKDDRAGSGGEINAETVSSE